MSDDNDAFDAIVKERDRGDARPKPITAVCEHGQLQRQCPLCELRAELAARDAEIAALRSLLNSYNLGGWTDADRLAQECERLRTIVAQEVQLLDEGYDICSQSVVHRQLRAAIAAQNTRPTPPTL